MKRDTASMMAQIQDQLRAINKKLDEHPIEFTDTGRPPTNRSINANKRHLISQYKWGAKKRGLLWELNPDDLEMLFKGNCHYCGSPPSKIKDGHKRGDDPYLYNGIDRMDNTM